MAQKLITCDRVYVDRHGYVSIPVDQTRVVLNYTLDGMTNESASKIADLLEAPYFTELPDGRYLALRIKVK